MARKLRLEYPGAIYHVINRGNYRGHIFATPGARAAFEECLFEACGKSGWILHAFVIMGNHYHLALETPVGNLVVGMQWLQATFASRFNRLRGERGHLFQGRYKSLLVEAGPALGSVCHYIHLNPVRAGLVSVEQLANHRHSSYWYLSRKADRPAFLQPGVALTEPCRLGDDAQGWQAYAQYLAWQATEGPAGKTPAYVRLSRGWALGGAAFKEALVQDHLVKATSRAWEVAGKAEIQQLQWSSLLAKCLQVLGKTKAMAERERKSAPWKLAIAACLKQTTQANNGWLCRQLRLGTPAAFSRNLSFYRRRDLARDPVWRKIISISAT